MAHPKEFAEGLSIGIIMDGNGRWAKNRGLPRTAGHKKGAAVFKDIANYCDELGVASVYFYAFSTENWKRPLEEVGAIMKLFAQYLIEGFDYKNRNIAHRLQWNIIQEKHYHRHQKHCCCHRPALPSGFQIFSHTIYPRPFLVTMKSRIPRLSSFLRILVMFTVRVLSSTKLSLSHSLVIMASLDTTRP